MLRREEKRLRELDTGENIARLKRADVYYRKQLEIKIEQGPVSPGRASSRPPDFVHIRAVSPRVRTSARPHSARGSAPSPRRPPPRPVSASARLARPGATDELAALRRAQNEQLLALLESEAAVEKGREAALKRVADATERRRLDKIFGHERAEASAQIISLTAAHEGQLVRRMEALGLL